MLPIPPVLRSIASNALHGPTGILRNQESMQDQHGAYSRGEATQQKCFVFPNILMNGCFAPTIIGKYPISLALRSTPAPLSQSFLPISALNPKCVHLFLAVLQ